MFNVSLGSLGAFPVFDALESTFELNFYFMLTAILYSPSPSSVKALGPLVNYLNLSFYFAGTTAYSIYPVLI